MALWAHAQVNTMAAIGYGIAAFLMLLLIAGALYTAFRPEHWPE